MEDQKINQRIAIIGAGAAGLTAAETLKDKGYENIVIFERNSRAGGKCCTVDFDGRLYEMGAGIVAQNNETVLRLAEKYNVQIERANFGKSILVDADTGKVTSEGKIRENFKLAGDVLLRYRKLFKKYPNVSSPGFAGLDSDLSMSFSEFAKINEIESLATKLELFFTGYGYDYFDRVSAAYVLKYFSWETIKSFAKRKIYTFPTGIQSLWTAIAQGHDVRYDVVIEKVKRGDAITVTTQDGEFEFDRLIVTSPLDEFLKVADESSKETGLFAKIEFVDYRTVACGVSGMERLSGYVPGNFSETKAGHPVFWYFRHDESDVYMFYVLADWKQSDDEVVQKIEDLIERMSGSLKDVREIERWKYFPHVSPQEFRNGFFEKMEGMQGENNTYFAGELMNFSTVGLTSEYAENLIDRFF